MAGPGWVTRQSQLTGPGPVFCVAVETMIRDAHHDTRHVFTHACDGVIPFQLCVALPFTQPPFHFHQTQTCTTSPAPPRPAPPAPTHATVFDAHRLALPYPAAVRLSGPKRSNVGCALYVLLLDGVTEGGIFMRPAQNRPASLTRKSTSPRLAAAAAETLLTPAAAE